MDYTNNYYPRIEKTNSERVLDSIITRLKNSGFYKEITDLNETEIEKAIPVHFELFKSVLNVAREYKTYVFNLHENFGYSLFSAPSSSAAQNVVNALQLAMLDSENDYINFYIHDLNFGNLWEKGMVVDEDGKDYPLKNDIDLWTLLIHEIFKEVVKKW